MGARQFSGALIISPASGIAHNSATQEWPLGAQVRDRLGNSYRYVKANEAVALGELVTAVALAAWDSTTVVDGAITANTTNILHVDTNTSAWTQNQYAGYFVCQALAAGKGKQFAIRSHDAVGASGEVDVILEENMDEAFADGAVLSIYNPFLVELTDGGTDHILGVGIGTITASYYGFVQVGGFVQAVLCDGSNGAAVVANEPIVPYATDPGQGQGMAGSAEGDIMEAAASPLIALRASSTDAAFVPAYMKER